MTSATVGQSTKSDKERLIGTWTLVSVTSGEGASQTLPYGPNPKGTMMVDANGRFSITVVRSDLPKFSSNNRMSGTPEENKAIVQGIIAYFGTYSIDEATHVLTVNVEGSTFPNFTGGTQTRILSFDGDEMAYFNPTPSMGGSAKVTYRRGEIAVLFHTARHRLSTVHAHRRFIASGGLISNGSDIDGQYRDAAR